MGRVMRPESASSDRLQHARGNNSARALASEDSTSSSGTPRPLGLRRWTRHVLEFVPLWLVLAACAGWFAYGCGTERQGSGCEADIGGESSIPVGQGSPLSISGCGLTTTSPVTWSAAPAGYLSVSLANSTQNEGVVYGLSATPSGMPVTVTATYTGGSATIQITVTGPTLQSITVTDADNGIAPAGGLGDQFTATGVYSDQSTNNLTNYVNWGSSVTTVAQFTGTFGTIGLASPLAPGDTLVTAGFTIGSANPIVGTEVLTVGTLQSITVTDADNGTAPPSTTDQFTATGTYAGGATQNLTTLVNWSSGNTAVALFQSSPAPAGDALTGVTGTALITATLTAGTSAAWQVARFAAC